MQRKLKISIFLYLFICINSYSDIKKSDFRELKQILKSNKYEYLIGGTENNDINFIEIRQDRLLNENGSLLIIFDKTYKVQKYIECERQSTFSPFFITDDYLVIGIFREKENMNKCLILYDRKINELRNIVFDYHYIDNLFIYGDLLFFSSEMANPHLNVINLKTNKLTACEKYYCPSAEYGVINGEVYARCGNVFYLYKNETFEKLDSKISGFTSKTYTVDELKIECDILDKLKY